MQESGYDGLRMERLFELLLFSSQVKFLVYTKTQVYWSTEEPILFNESFQNINDEFQRIVSKFGLVLYTRDVMQCSTGRDPPSAAELIRRDIIAAYNEHGLDVDFKRKVIEKSQGEVSSLKGSRQATRYMPSPPTIVRRVHENRLDITSVNF